MPKKMPTNRLATKAIGRATNSETPTAHNSIPSIEVNPKCRADMAEA